MYSTSVTGALGLPRTKPFWGMPFKSFATSVALWGTLVAEFPTVGVPGRS